MSTKVFKSLPVIDSNYLRTGLVYHPTIWPKRNPNFKPIKKYFTVCNRIRVSKLDPTTKADDLHEEFSYFGPIASITKVKIIRPKNNDRIKEGLSFITFFLKKHAKLALSSAIFLKGRFIYVEQAVQELQNVNYRAVPVKRIYSMQTLLAVHEKYKKYFLEQDVDCSTKVYVFIHRIDPDMPKNMKRSTILDPYSDYESSSSSLDNVELEEQVFESHTVQESNPWLEKQILEWIPVVPENLYSLNNAEFNNFIYLNPIYIETNQTSFQDLHYLNHQVPEYHGINNAEFNNVVYPKPIYIESDQTYFQDPEYLNNQVPEYHGVNDAEFNNDIYPKPIYTESVQTYFQDPDYLNNQVPEYHGVNDAEFNNVVYPKPIYIESDQTYFQDSDYLNNQVPEYHGVNDAEFNNVVYPKPIYIESDQIYFQDPDYLNNQVVPEYHGVNDAEFNNVVYPKPIYIESNQTYFQDPDYLNNQVVPEYHGVNDAEFNNVVYPKPIYIESNQTYFQDPDYLNNQVVPEYHGVNDAEFNNVVYPKPIYIENDQTYFQDADAEFNNFVDPKPINHEGDQRYLENFDYLNYQESEYPLTTSSAYYYGENQIINDPILQNSLVPVYGNHDYDLNNEYSIPEENINYDLNYVDPSMNQNASVPIMNAFETEYNQFYEFSPTVIATVHEYEMSNQLNVENQYADLPDQNYIQVHSSQLHEYEMNDQYYDGTQEMSNMQLNHGIFEEPHVIQQPMIPSACEMHEHETNYQYYDDAQMSIDLPMVPENDGISEVPYLIEQPMIPLTCEMHEYEADYRYCDDAHIISDFAKYDGIEMSMIQKNDIISEVPHIVEHQTISPACEIHEVETDEAQIIDLTEYEDDEVSMILENDGTFEVPRINPYQHYSETCDELLKQLNVLRDQFHKSHEVDKHDKLQSQCNINDTVEDAKNSFIFKYLNISQSDTQDRSISNQSNLLKITETVIEPSTSINEKTKQDTGKSEIESQIPDKLEDSSKCGSRVFVRDIATQFPEYDKNLINTSTPEVDAASFQNMETQTINTPENINKESMPLRLTFADVTKRAKRQK